MSDDAWTVDQYLTAELADRQAWTVWAIQNRNVPKTKRSKEPQPLSRPSDARKRKAKQEYNLAKARIFQAVMAARETS